MGIFKRKSLVKHIGENHPLWYRRLQEEKEKHFSTSRELIRTKKELRELQRENIIISINQIERQTEGFTKPIHITEPIGKSKIPPKILSIRIENINHDEER